ncbi:DUF2207 domain-containing protein, partial [Hyphomonas sp.]|uniref:DUF2207 domain-containing protein n=1 Tax=Hyphomonas sp. TaxID=87 RepID=UPI0030F511CA
MRPLIALLLALTLAMGAMAEERINRFDVDITVQTNGDIVVSETLAVTSEGYQIRRGILRNLPRYYDDDGAKLPYDYMIMQVTRDGAREPYSTETDGNALIVRIGSADVFLENGPHVYEITYRVKNQIRYFADHDEIYWNATGNYWDFPIDAATATITLPQGARVTAFDAYTGGLGTAGKDFTHQSNGDSHVFTTTRALQSGEGLTVAVGVEKGVIDPPSSADETRRWWQRNGSLAILLASLLGVFGFSMRNFNKVGRDPVKGPVFPRYAPPEGYSPAGVHYIYYRSLAGHKALIATLMNLAVKGHLKIEAGKKKQTTLTRTPETEKPATLAAEDVTLEAGLFRSDNALTLGKKYDATFTAAYTTFQLALSRAYGAKYFKWNIGYSILALLLSGGALALAITQATQWSWWHTGVVISLAALNGWFMYLMPAPTRKGQAVRTEIEGFKLYMETAEKLQLNAVEVGSEAPPPMTTERYETFLPYAVALGVEKPWTKHFERLIPEEAAAYNPAWTNMSSGGFRNIGEMT